MKNQRFYLTFTKNSLYHEMISEYGLLFTRSLLDKFFSRYLSDKEFREEFTFFRPSDRLSNDSEIPNFL